ncbi:MAG: hypothetical protein KCHDKBKB_01295 [Elusimicrobia bacterium]|nr:hypothetical protein [Elusimicrobiota bacterium]
MIELVAVGITVLVLILLVVFHRSDQDAKIKELEKRQLFESFLSGKGFSSNTNLEAHLNSIGQSVRQIKITRGAGSVAIREAFLSTRDNASVLCRIEEWSRHGSGRFSWVLVWPAKDDGAVWQVVHAPKSEGEGWMTKIFDVGFTLQAGKVGLKEIRLTPEALNDHFAVYWKGDGAPVTPDPTLLDALATQSRFRWEKAGAYYFLQEFSVFRGDSDEKEINRLLPIGDAIKKAMYEISGRNENNGEA